MLDFTSTRAYSKERTRKQRFLEKKLQTEEEHSNQINMGDDDSDFGGYLDMDTTFGGGGIDLGGDFSDFGDFGDFGSDMGGMGGGKRSELANDTTYQTGVWWKDILYSPWFLFLYVGKLLAYSFPSRDERKGIVEALSKITLFSALGSGILYLIGFKFIITLSFQFFTSLFMFVGSHALLKYVYNKEGSESKDTASEDSTDPFGSIGMDGFGDGGFGGTSFGDGFSEGSVGGFGTGEGIDFSEPMLDMGDDDDIFGDDVDVPKYDSYEAPLDSDKVLPPSPIDVSSNKAFGQSLLGVFRENAKYQGQTFGSRREILTSLSKYLITNDAKFGSWEVLKERGTEYENVAYSLYKGLCQIRNSFGTDEEVMVVYEIKKNPLLYRIEVELPSYFNPSMIRNKLGDIEDNLKRNDEDTKVQVAMSSYGGKYIFKFMRLDNKNFISLGDIMRYYDEEEDTTALDSFDNNKLGLPLLLGLRDMEYPYIVDLEENTSGVIVGGSGSGKSWLTFLIFLNIVYSNDYNNVHFVIMDVKDAPFWNQFAKFPHVLGYHTKYEKYLDLIQELKDEVDRRKELLKELNAENIKGLRENLRNEENYEELKKVPLLIIVLDEITTTMQDLKEYYGDEDKESYDIFRNSLSQITQVGRSLGVRLISIGQRAIDTSIPKNVMATSTFKFAMKMDVESDFTIMLGKDAERAKKPYDAGVGISQVQGQAGLASIKTLTVGGTSDDHMLMLIRVLALEWVRRSIGVDDIINPPPGYRLEKAYNRDKFVSESLRDLELGRILSPVKVDEGYAMEDIGVGPVVRNLEATEDEPEEDIYDMLSESYEDSIGDVLQEIEDEEDEVLDGDVDIDIDALISQAFGEDTGEGISDIAPIDDSLDYLSVDDTQEASVTDETVPNYFGNFVDSTEEEFTEIGNVGEEDMGIFMDDGEDAVLSFTEDFTEDFTTLDTEVSYETEPRVTTAPNIPPAPPITEAPERPNPIPYVKPHEPVVGGEPPITPEPVKQKVVKRRVESPSSPPPTVKKVKKVRRVKKVVPVDRRGVNVSFKGGEVLHDTRLSIKDFIIQEGKRLGVVNYAISQARLHEEYSEKEIETALDRLEIIEDGSNYVTRV